MDSNITVISAALADPARALMVNSLMDGRALTAGELAKVAGVTPQTASGHLARLVDAGILIVASQGRHRYFAIAGHRVAELLEQLSIIAADVSSPSIRTGPRDPALRDARICYDHLAGERGVALLTALRDREWLEGDDANLLITEPGHERLTAFGIDVDAVRSRKRPSCRACLDWSVRRPHLAGGLGAALLSHFMEKGWARRVQESRIISFSPEGLRQFDLLIAPD